MIRILLLGLIIFFTNGIYASLIDNGDYTTDTESGLDWLDLTFSKGYSYNDLISETSSGGVFEGYRLATMSQVDSLYISAGLPTSGNSTVDFLSVDSLIDLIGATSTQSGYAQSIGITATPAEFSGHKVAGLDFYFDSGQPTYSLINNLVYGDSFGPDSVGGWLVREAISVPEPSSLLILLTGFLLLLKRNNIKSKVISGKSL